MIWTDAHDQMLMWASAECEKQRSGERSVFWMVKATLWAIDKYDGDPHVSVGLIHMLGSTVEPDLNSRGFRRTNVRVGMDKMPPWEEVPRLIETLVKYQYNLTPDEFYKEFEEVHPFRDGNGRVGTILWNWQMGHFEEPKFKNPPDFWGPQLTI